VVESEDPILEEFLHRLPNNFPIPNENGFGASFSTEGSINLDGEFNTAQGTNGRHCGTCHAVESGWSIVPFQIHLLFELTDGTHPIFNPLDANNPNMPVATEEERRAAYSNLLRGLFRRGGNVPSTAQYTIVAVDDPHGFASTTRFSFFRRPLTTANMTMIAGVGWDDRNTVAGDARPPRAGLRGQARGNITGAQQGAPPADATVNAIVEEELMIFTAQKTRDGISLDSCGARGGPEHLSTQTLISGRWDLFDAWINLAPGSCSNRRDDRKRAQIARGQEIFNERLSATGGRCRGCHNVVNNGTNLNGTMFDVRTSDASVRPAHLPLYTLRNNTTGELRQTSDPGKAFASGQWSDVNRFKSPTLRGLSGRAPYFHNGISATLRDVVQHYSVQLGFNFTQAEEDDLVAFLEAL
jgi:cytochrome c peroxidase